MLSDPELVQVLGAMLPDPVYALCRFVPKISSVKIPAQEKHKQSLPER